MRRKPALLTAAEVLAAQTPQCGVCRYWREQTGTEDEFRWGECHRRPPTVYIQTDPDTGAVGTDKAWPPTTEEEWCGDWSASQ